MDLRKKTNFFLLIFFVLLTAQTYSQVSVQLQQPPPYQFKVEQFWKVILTNNSRVPVNIYLKGTATQSLQGKIIEATSSVITLQPGVKVVSGQDLGPFTISESNSHYKDIMINTGSVPSGDYNICVMAFDASSGKVLATDCISVTVENFNRMELISPFDQEVIGNISEEATENLKLKSINISPVVIFSWLPPIPPNARFSYRLKIVEVLGYQSVYAAMASNPIYYQSSIISATVVRYPIAAQQLMPGRKYAWVVEAFVDDFKTQESEIRSFEIAGNDELADKYASDNSETVNRYGDADFNQHSGLPSGLSVMSNRNYGTQSSSIFTTMQQNSSFGSSSDFKFSGDAKFTEVSSSKPAQFSQLPTNYWTLAINPRISIYNIPFGMNIYLSSLNKASMQSINSFSFNLDIDQLKSKITDRISEKIREVQSSAGLSSEKLKKIEALKDPMEIKDRIYQKVKEIQSSADSSLSNRKDIDRISEKIMEIQSSTDSPIEKLKKLELLSDPAYLEKIKEIEALNDPTKLAENAERLGMLSPAEKFFLDIKAFGVGRTYPEYSELTVSGVPVNGLNIEYNPGIFYVAAAAWNNLDGINDVSFKRSFFAGRLGVGKKENAHLFFTLLKIKDDDQSIPAPTNSFLTPQENQVIGSEGKVFLFNNLLSLKGEGDVSMFTRDIRDADMQNGSLPGFVNSIYNPKISTSYDYAFSGSAVFDQPKNDTYASFAVTRIGPGYTSLAAPNISSDQLMLEGKINKKFPGKIIGMKFFVKYYQDNIVNWKSSTTTTAALGLNFDFNFPNVPYFAIGYSPYFQGNDNVPANQLIKNDNHIINFMTGYSYQLAGMFASTLFSFNGQWQDSKVGLLSSKFSNTSYMLNQSFNFEFPLTLSSTLSLTQSKSPSFSSDIMEFDLSGNYQISKMISANLGTTFSNEENLTKRIMISMGSNITISEWLRLALQGNISNYTDLSGGSNNYTDSMMQVSLLVKW